MSGFSSEMRVADEDPREGDGSFDATARIVDAGGTDDDTTVEAALRPTMRFVEPKTQEQQARAVAFRTREQLVKQRTEAVNALRSHLYEFGYIAPVGLRHLPKLVAVLEHKVGRILANGWPTGVEVASAMVHGGPFPATSDGRTTSVGTLAIDRFLRPVSYQDIPDDLLPTALRGEGVAGVPVRVNGVRKL